VKALLILCAGCMFGGGPTVAMRGNGKLAYGFDADFTVETKTNSYFGGGVGLSSDGVESRKYADLVATYYNVAVGQPNGLGLSAAVGYAEGGPPATPMVSLSPTVFSNFRQDCTTHDSPLVLAMYGGLRWMGHWEVFVTPRVSLQARDCFGMQ
jgi:hypothetical protein